MIVYFANRKMEILGHVSTNLKDGYIISDDLKTEDIDTGVASFECRIGFTTENRLKLEEMTNAGNYLLRKHQGENEFYTILETEIDTKNQEVYVYAEDAGLDLINEIVGEYAAVETHTAEYYINRFAGGSGFQIGINEIPETTTRKLSWDGESTVTERLASVATQFGGFEVSYSFDVKGMEITNKYINIYEERGKNTEEQLRLNYEIDKIVTTKSVANLATAFLCTGGTPDDSDKPITLNGYTYDDGDFYVDGKYLKSRKALENWNRYLYDANDSYDGHIVKQYSYDTTSQQTLCSHAITELKKVCDMEVNYEVDINTLPDNISVGDRVNIVDDAGELYLSTRLLQLETSVVNQSQKATLGENLIKGSGISEKVIDLASQFASIAQKTEQAKALANTANTNAAEAITQTEAMTESVTAAQTAANSAVEKVDNLEIGGRNLALETGNPITIIGANALNQSQDIYFTAINFQDYIGKKMTISFDYSYSEDTDVSTLTKANIIISSTPFTIFADFLPTVDNLSGHYQNTIVISSEQTSCSKINTSFDYFTGSVTISNLKIETGDKATYWTTAPEDDNKELKESLIEQTGNIIVETEGILNEALKGYAQNDETKTVTSHNIYYLASAQTDEVEINETWTETLPTLTSDNSNLWCYEKLTYSDGSTETIEPYILTTYNSSLAISIIDNYYSANNNEQSAIDSAGNEISFTGTIPELDLKNIYLWNYKLITYSDNTTFETEKKVIGKYYPSALELNDEFKTQLKELSDQMTISISELANDYKENDTAIQQELNNITTFFSFSINGLTIGKTDSPYKVFIDDNEFSMLLNENRVLWFELTENSHEANIPELTVTDKFKLYGLEITDENNIISCGLLEEGV